MVEIYNRRRQGHPTQCLARNNHRSKRSHYKGSAACLAR